VPCVQGNREQASGSPFEHTFLAVWQLHLRGAVTLKNIDDLFIDVLLWAGRFSRLKFVYKGIAEIATPIEVKSSSAGIDARPRGGFYGETVNRKA
jgi:hypothetical protein